MNYKSLPIIAFSIFCFAGQHIAFAQETKETVQPLSGKALKGYLYDVSKDESGNQNVTYQMKVDKKSDAITYEKYSFDKDLKFVGSTETQVSKEQKDDVERTYYYANVGGTTSFDILSQKLKLNKMVQLLTWDRAKQIYKVKKTISNVTIKPKNDDGKVFYGYASYSPQNDAKSDVFVLAKVDTKDKVQKDKFIVVLFNESLEIKEKPLELSGSYSLVFSNQLANDDVVMVFAPNKGAADVAKYVYFQFDITGNLKNKIEFTSPASALLISAAYEMNGNIYFFGTSTKSSDAFTSVFSEYAPIYNPGAARSGMAGNNLKDFDWRKCLNEKMDNFHLLKISGNQLLFASTTPVADFKSKFKTAAGDKGATAYKGKKFLIEKFYITANEEYLVAGQLTSSVIMGGTLVDTYEDIVCFHFEKNGNLKAQYGIGKMNNDKKSEIFDMAQNFYPSADGKSLYWELLEVKGTKGYASFMDAYYGAPTFYPLFFPRIVKIDLNTASLGTVKVLGNEDYFLRKDFTSSFDKNENSVTYIGHDEDWKKLWVGKLMIQ